ncbi:uncharacterized protein LOC142922261 [Petromyzon marinus]|uniref:uncharacterized protein LOC142922261 n=1 Tax=Petromyzon marinus TaxID=7757 RepID=UPI003F719E8B
MAVHDDNGDDYDGKTNVACIKAQEDEDTITRLREELKASKEELAASEAERASAQPELSTPQQGLSALQDQLTTSQAENEDTLRQLFERSQELGSLHAGILWYQRMLAELHTELEQYRENAQIGRSQLQHLDMLRQQSEAELIDRNWQLESLQAEIQWYQRVVAELHAELAPYRDNEQSGHSEQQRLQSEVELVTVEEEEDISGCSLEPGIQEASQDLPPQASNTL